MIKTFKLILINILIFILLFFLSEYIVYFFCIKTNPVGDNPPQKFHYLLRNPDIYIDDISNFFNGKSNNSFGRLPVGQEYNTTPITLFGCSYAFGQGLEPNQTFGYKLSELLKRPVYNRAVPGQSFQEMYYQSSNKNFYRQVPPCDTVIYIMMTDNIRRLYTNIFDMNVLGNYFMLHYDIKDGQLIYQDYSNPIMNFIKSLYIVKLLHLKFTYLYVTNPKNQQKIADDTVLYFTETRKNLENKWKKKIKFYILFYQDKFLYSDLLKEKLEYNGFRVVELYKLTKENINSDKYKIQNDVHPNEAAWDLITPLFIEFMQKDENSEKYSETLNKN